VPGARVVAAFNTIPGEVLFSVFDKRDQSPSPDMLYYGDDEAAKKVAAELARDVGFNPVDAGPLGTARYAEPFALLVAHLAYQGKGGPKLAYRFIRPAE
jgi:predicted dinucleotide-binding enzyme